MNGNVVGEELIFTTTDSTVVSVENDGTYTMNSVGTAEILIQMKNKPSCIKSVNMIVGEEISDDIELVPDVRNIKLNCSVRYNIASNNDVSVFVKSDNPSYYYKYKLIDSKTFEIKNMKQSKYPVVITCTDGNITKEFEIMLGGLL